MVDRRPLNLHSLVLGIAFIGQPHAHRFGATTVEPSQNGAPRRLIVA